jgi:hypothetical protein
VLDLAQLAERYGITERARTRAEHGAVDDDAVRKQQATIAVWRLLKERNDRAVALCGVVLVSVLGISTRGVVSLLNYSHILDLLSDSTQFLAYVVILCWHTKLFCYYNI